MLALFCVCVLVWTVDNGRWTAAAWHLPTVYNGDAHEILARIQASSEGNLLPLRPQKVDRLGAPFVADWSAYPTPEKIPLHLLGLIARATDVFFAANCGLAIAFGLSAVAFYWVVRRWLGARGEWAAVGGVLFAFNYSIYHRGLAHFSFALAWVVPLGLLACWLVARSRRLAWGSAGMWICFAAAAALGCHNTYYLFFWLPLIGWAWLAQWFGPRRTANLAIGATAVAIALGAFLTANFEFWAYSASSDARPLLERNYGGTELYALKAVELFIPPAAHRAEALAFLGQRYYRWTEWKGEGYLPYLGLLGIVAFGWLLWRTVPRLLRGRTLPGPMLTTGWLLAFGAAGGITNFLAFFGGLFVFRATNRIGIFIAAIVLAFFVTQISRLARRWPGWVRFGAALAVAAIGLADQLPRQPPNAQAEIASRVASDRAFGAELERRLPAGAAIFQLPVLPFPEVKPPWRLHDYEHFRLYLTTRTLRFSYGAMKFRPRVRWQQELEALAPAQIARRLERYGFSALYVNRHGYEDEAEGLLRALAAAGYREQLASPLGGQVVVLLHPAREPELPLARSFTLGLGWHNRPTNGVRWAYGPASLLYYNALPRPIAVRIELRLQVPDARELRLHHGAVTLASVQAAPGTVNLDVARAELAPGLNVLHLDSNEGIRSAKTGGQLRTFALESSAVLPLESPPSF